MKKDSVKNIRINEEVLKELSVIISREVKDPRVAPFTSVVSVEVAPDLKTCKVYISVLGDNDTALRTLEGLNSSKGFIRRELAHRVNLRNTPELIFKLDTSIAYAANMYKLMDELHISDSDETDVNDADSAEEDDENL